MSKASPLNMLQIKKQTIQIKEEEAQKKVIIALQESLDSHIYNYLYSHFEITDDP